jgi:hypothetical protein
VLLTQYFDTMKDIGISSGSKVILVPHSPSGMNDVIEQIRNAIITGNEARSNCRQRLLLLVVIRAIVPAAGLEIECVVFLQNHVQRREGGFRRPANICPRGLASEMRPYEVALWTKPRSLRVSAPRRVEKPCSASPRPSRAEMTAWAKAFIKTGTPE